MAAIPGQARVEEAMFPTAQAQVVVLTAGDADSVPLQAGARLFAAILEPQD